MKKKWLFALSFLLFILIGGYFILRTAASNQKWPNENGWIKIGNKIAIEPLEKLTLLENKELLAADGLYYATWVTGNSVPYKNSDGDMINLYDAQLYFLAAETAAKETAAENCSAWLAAAKENYDVQTEDTITYGEQCYTIITYNCIGEDNPYDRGVSAFGAYSTNAVCAEFTCLKNYKEDLILLLTDFLNNCHYKAD